MKIKNKNYREFLDSGHISLIDKETFQKALDNVKGKRGNYLPEARALLIVLYYTGCRPIEALKMTAQNIKLLGSHLTILLKASKRGKTRTVYLPAKNPHMMELYTYASKLYPSMYIFHHYKSNYARVYKNKKGVEKVQYNHTDSLRYFIYKWFDGIIPNSLPPYFLRHNRFSKLFQRGASESDIMYLKGAKSMDSVKPYIHLSTEKAKKLSKIND